MNLFLLNVLLALAWGALRGSFDLANLSVGFILSYITLWFVFRSSEQARYFFQVPSIIKLLMTFLVDVVKANIRMARTILSPQMRLQPAVVGVPLDMRSLIGVVFLINIITLTPGTLALDVSTDRSILYVHTLWVDDKEEFINEIKQGYERQLMRILDS